MQFCPSVLLLLLFLFLAPLIYVLLAFSSLCFVFHLVNYSETAGFSLPAITLVFNEIPAFQHKVRAVFLDLINVFFGVVFS